MAADWIKVEKTTPRKTEVLRIAAMLGVHPDHAFGLCFRFWTWCDDNLRSANAGGVTLALVDSTVERAGFCEAMVSVGWLKPEGDTFVVENFERHLSKSAKNRGLTAKRVEACKTKKLTTNAETVTEPLPDALPELELDLILNTPPRAEEKTRRPMAESYPAQDAGIICVEVDGKLVHYDENPMVWEAEFIRQWNEARDTVKHSGPALTIAHRNLLKARLSDPDWHWKLALSKFPLASETGWKPGLLWFLEAASVQNILEERHGPRKPKGKKNDRPLTNPGQVFDSKQLGTGVNTW